MTVILLASLTVVLVTVAAFMVYDLVTFRQAMVRRLTTQARIVAENSTGDLAFRNENDAANVLATLREEPRVVAAAIYDSQGRLFVKYPAQMADSLLPAAPGEPGYHFGRSNLTIFEPVVQADKKLGTLYLESDLKAITQRLELYGAISLMIIVGSMLVALWLSNTLQSRISNPIIVLAETARKISDERNYSLRAPQVSDDELGMLTNSFNGMLELIEKSDAVVRASEAQFRLVTDQAPVLLAHVARDYRYKFVNKSYAEHYEGRPEDFVGKLAADVVGKEIFARALPHVEKVLGGEPVQFEMEISHPGSPPRWSHVAYTPERGPDGAVVGLVAVHTDITLRKQTEIEIARARDQALAASRAKDDFLAALSHELRTPLNPVLLVASDGAGNAQLSSEIREVFEMIRRNVELEARLIDDLLDLTRITRGKLLLDLRPVEVVAILRDALATVQAEADEKHITIVRDWEVQPLRGVGDAVRVQQVFWNVLKNAVKFTPAGGRVTIQTRREGSRARVVVADTGIGLTPGEIGQIFNAFSQGDHAGPEGSHKFGGLGLGLAISHMLVELHGGEIRAASAGRNEGATFTVEMPLTSAAAEAQGGLRTAPPLAVTVNGTARREGRRILLVEDHEPTRVALTHLLTRRLYKVSPVGSLAEARELAGRETFDLVLSDIGLPDGNGYTLMSELRDKYQLPGIALTGYGMDQDISRARAAGFVTHLTKPVRVESLEQALLEVK